jgi:hypothetical protein
LIYRVNGESTTNMSGEQRINTEQAVSQALVACMGVQACGRVCQALGVEAPKPYIDAEALPYEKDCSSLNETETMVTNIYRGELLQAVAMPNVEPFGVEGTAVEAKSYLEYLESGHDKFENYLVAVLKGTSLPRTASVHAAEAWRTHAYTSPNAEILTTSTEDEKASARVLFAQLRGFHDLDKLKEQGLLFDTNIQAVLKESAGELSVGHHIKLTGEPGIAKTTIAKYLGRLNARAHHPEWTDEACEPVLISLSSTAEAEAQVSEQTFTENTLGNRLGIIARAMQEGRVVILDEQNGMTADQQVYFNDMFLKSPADRIRVGNEIITIAPGFAVIATVNPMTDTQGNRRHGRQQQDSAGAARYTRIDMLYPGQSGYSGQPKETLSRLFYAHYVDQYGWQQPQAGVLKVLDNSAEYLVKLTKKATEPPTDGTSAIGLLAAAAARPELAECITPRDFSRMLERVMAHADVNTLPSALRVAMATKTEQILHSDNGHFVTPAAKQAVETLQTENGFKLKSHA